MSVWNIALLCAAVGALTLFGGVHAWASWLEARDGKKKAMTANPKGARNEITSSVGRIPNSRTTPKIVHRPF
jgi:hypothetical protein